MAQTRPQTARSQTTAPRNASPQTTAYSSAAELPAADVIADCEGLLCPLPVLRARKHLLAMAPGAVLCLRVTDGMAAIDLPHFCRESGHHYLGSRREGEVTLHFLRAGEGRKAGREGQAPAP